VKINVRAAVKALSETPDGEILIKWLMAAHYNVVVRNGEEDLAELNGRRLVVDDILHMIGGGNNER